MFSTIIEASSGNSILEVSTLGLNSSVTYVPSANWTKSVYVVVTSSGKTVAYSLAKYPIYVLSASPVALL